MIHNLDIRKVNNREEIPFNLLLLADPSKDLIEHYIDNSMIYVAYSNDQTIGCFVLSELINKTIEKIQEVQNENKSYMHSHIFIPT